MIKIYQKSLKQSTQGKEKGTRFKDSSLGQKKTTNKGELQGEHEQIKYSNPRHKEHIK
jgi:hypothetical protein